MSMTYSIRCTTADEWEALQSEGAPEVNMSNSNALTLAVRVLGLTVEEDCFVMFDPADVLDREEYILDVARCWDEVDSLHAMPDYWETRASEVMEVARAAQRLGRQVVAV